MPAYVKQHYVPRFYLNYFATLESQKHPNKKRWKVYVHHKDFNETTADPPFIPEVAYGEWYYAREDAQDMYMEHSLGNVETLAGEVIKKINETRDVSWLTARDRKRLADFMAFQHVRVPKQRGFGYRSLIERTFPGYTAQQDQAHLYTMMRFVVLLAPFIFRMGSWELVENETDIPLITSDSPVSTMAFRSESDGSSPKDRLYYLRALMGLIDFCSHNPDDYPTLGFNIPLSPSLLLVARPKTTTVVKIELRTEEDVRSQNKVHAVQSYEQLYASTADFENLEAAKQMSASFHSELKVLDALMPGV